MTSKKTEKVSERKLVFGVFVTENDKEVVKVETISKMKKEDVPLVFKATQMWVDSIANSHGMQKKKALVNKWKEMSALIDEFSELEKAMRGMHKNDAEEMVKDATNALRGIREGR